MDSVIYTEEKIIDKIRKLLKLAEKAGTPEESAAAAAMAAEWQEKYRIESILLEDKGEIPAEGIGTSIFENNRESWLNNLSSALAKANGCRIYYHGPQIMLVGRESDKRIVTELYGMLTIQVSFLTISYLNEKRRGRKGNQEVLAINFKLGCVDTIREKLEIEQQKRADARKWENNAGANSGAMVLYRHDIALSNYMDSLNLRFVKQNSGPSNENARAAGREAAKNLSVTIQNKIGNNSGQKRLN